jgi:hypothetical protein
VVHLTLVGGVAAESSRHLDEHRRSGALEFILCSTPLSPEEIMAGQWLALRRQFQRPLKVVVAADLLVMVLSLTPCMEFRREDRFTFTGFMAVAIVMLVVDMFAAGWVGMWRAMANKRPKQNVAVMETVFLLVILPFMLMGLVLALIGLASHFIPVFGHWLDGWSDTASFFCVLGLWFILAMAVATGCSFLARRQLQAQFREMAVVQGGEPLGILGQLGRLLGKVFRRQPRRTAI